MAAIKIPIFPGLLNYFTFYLVFGQPYHNRKSREHSDKQTCQACLWLVRWCQSSALIGCYFNRSLNIHSGKWNFQWHYPHECWRWPQVENQIINKHKIFSVNWSRKPLGLNHYCKIFFSWNRALNEIVYEP